MEDQVLAGRYRLGASLGEGSMGQVWLADDQLLGRQVAIKKLRAAGGAPLDPSAIDRMVREARTAASLHHAHAVAIFDLIHLDGQPYLVMQYVNGESLAHRISRLGQLPIPEAARIIGQVAGALEAAHRAGIVHRDIKPANILLNLNHDAQLADFGIARTTGDPALTTTGQLIGTVA